MQEHDWKKLGLEPAVVLAAQLGKPSRTLRQARHLHCRRRIRIRRPDLFRERRK
jgi:hypothetical protein